jgi:hypothetical protein
MKPVSPHVNIRKSQKLDGYKILVKVEDLTKKWNQGNDGKAYEKQFINLEEAIE